MSLGVTQLAGITGFSLLDRHGRVTVTLATNATMTRGRTPLAAACP